jgi:AcrR family transcriptional regulator
MGEGISARDGMDPRDHKRIKSEILGKIAQIFSRLGYSETTMERVSEDVGMSKKTLYRYFPNKDGMVREIVEGWIREWDADLRRICRHADVPVFLKFERALRPLRQLSGMLHGENAQDLKRGAPEIWRTLCEFRNKDCYLYLKRIAREGRAQGFIQKGSENGICFLGLTIATLEPMGPGSGMDRPPEERSLMEDFLNLVLGGIPKEKLRAGPASQAPVMPIRQK